MSKLTSLHIKNVVNCNRVLMKTSRIAKTEKALIES